MAIFLLRKVLKYAAVFFASTFTLFWLIGKAPSSSAESPGGPAGYIEWLSKAAHQDFGRSQEAGAAASDFFFERLKSTLILATGGVLFSLLVSVLLGALIMKGRIRQFERLSVPIYMITAAPVFILCFFIEVFMHRLFPEVLPTEAKYAALYYVLGLLVLGAGNNALGDISRALAAELGRVLSEQYITAAKARGVRVFGQVFRAVLLQMMNVAAARYILAIGGGVIVAEYVFRINGLGLYMFDAVRSETGGDVLLLIAVVLIGVVCVCYLINDLVRALIDRRGLYE